MESRKVCKRVTAVLLAFVMMVVFMPAMAFADDNSNAGTEGTPGTKVTAPAENGDQEQTGEDKKTGENTEEPTVGDNTENPTAGGNTEEPKTEEPTEDPTPAVEPEVKQGWQKESGKYYYYKDGEKQKLTGKHSIGGEYYYFNTDNSRYTGWKTIGKDKYYFNAAKDGAAAKGVLKIGKTYYGFNEKSGAAKSKGFFWTKNKKYKYYSKGAGKLMVGGWKAINGGAYYFYSSGKIARNTKVKYLKVGSSGNAGKAYYEGIKVLNKNGWSLKAAYKYSYKIRYKNRWMRKKTSEEYALYGFKNKYGNCFVMASTFYVMGKLLGYDIHQINGHVNAGLPHSWTEIGKKGKARVYDPNFRNETGRNGWNIYYGKKGTWRYKNYKRMN